MISNFARASACCARFTKPGSFVPALAIPLALLVACHRDAEAVPGTTVRMDFGDDAFWSAPFPADPRRGADGKVGVSAFPNPYDKPFVGQVLDIVDGTLDGFGTTSPVFLPVTDALDPASLADHVKLIDTATGELAPIDVAFVEDGGPYGAPNLLSLLPIQGIPLHPSTVYAAVITTDATDAAGDPLGISLDMAQIAAGEAVPGVDEPEWTAAIDAVEAVGIERDAISGMTVFTTQDPTAALPLLIADARGRLHEPSAFELTDTFDTFCVYRATIDMPEYQEGEPPYTTEGGDILFEGGQPVYQRDETAAMWVTVPRATMPADGWPTVVMIPTGGGGDRPIVDRGTHAVAHGDAIEPGTGPALEFAAAGYAGVSIDGPHGGLRNITHGDQQFLLFNLTNPAAMLDNLRQSAMEVAITPQILDGVTIDTTDCDGAGSTFTVDGDHLALFGHSMGATIAPTGAAFAPEYGALVLSGAGGSWIMNVVDKQNPLDVRPLADVMIGYDADLGQDLNPHDPLLGLVQWGGEKVDPPVYGHRLTVDTPRDILMFQGIVDTYILPSIANPLTLALGNDLGGPAYDDDPRLAAFPRTDDLLPLVGSAPIDLPASGNRDGYTRITVQHPQDDVEDGHEVVFQTEEPKHQYRCFLASKLEGVPTVPADGGEGDPCP
jgi:hypothetical protein